MKLRYLLTFNAIIAAIFGIGFVLIPSTVMAQYGITANRSLTFVGQLFGVTLIGFSVLTWVTRKSGESDARRAIVLALFVEHVIGFIVLLIGQINGVVNSMGWITVALYLLLAIGYGIFFI